MTDGIMDIITEYNNLTEFARLSWKIEQYRKIFKIISQNVGWTLDEYQNTPKSFQQKISNIFNAIEFRDVIYVEDAVNFSKTLLPNPDVEELRYIAKELFDLAIKWNADDPIIQKAVEILEKYK